jgi:hypothetical protein
MESSRCHAFHQLTLPQQEYYPMLDFLFPFALVLVVVYSFKDQSKLPW